MTVQIPMKVGLEVFDHSNRSFLLLVELEKFEDEIFFFNKVIRKEAESRTSVHFMSGLNLNKIPMLEA